MNIVPQPETDVDAVIADSSMTAEEARRCIDEIKTYLNSVRVLLLNLDERRGWEALGYKSIRQCLKAELQGKLGKSVSQLYRELAAGKIERELSQLLPRFNFCSVAQFTFKATLTTALGFSDFPFSVFINDVSIFGS